MHKPHHSGGCQCGALRYRISGPLGHASICHCRMCQKAFGNVGAPLVNVALEHLVWTRGTPAVFRSSPPVQRGFCAACGTPMYMQDDGETVMDLAICTLDDPEAAPPTAQTGVESRLSWFAGLASLPQQTTIENNPAASQGHYRSCQHPDHDTEKWP